MRRLVFAAALVLPPIAFAQDHHPSGDPEKLGKVSFAVSCAPGIQPKFERAVAMLHSFWFDAANVAFGDIIKSDSTCALAYWGRAITLMGNPMTRVGPSPDRIAQGLALSQQAVSLAANATHREQMYAATALAYYSGSENHATRMKAHEQAWDALRKAHSDDMEAQIFHARTLVANASPMDLTFAQQIAAAEIMQPLFDKHPDHPGLAHYLIHAYDAPATAARGANAAKAYADIAPAAPHALHMPSHIFTRLGRWDESIETNQRSARAEPDSNAAVHPMDYMVYAYLQEGRERDAKRVIDRAYLGQNTEQFYGGVLGYNLVAMPARYVVERSAWSEAASLKVAPAAAPNVRALTHFTRAVGAARTGNAAQAKVEVEQIAAAKAQLDAAKDTYWATIVEAQRLAASAWVALAERDTAKAVALAKSGADLEETVEKHPVTPGPILPARELEGDMLMQLGRPAEALASYEKTLVREPRRFRALWGAARAAERSGNTAVAKARYASVVELFSKADASRAPNRPSRRGISLVTSVHVILSTAKDLLRSREILRSLRSLRMTGLLALAACTTERVDTIADARDEWRAPTDAEIPQDSLGAAIRRGLALVNNTSDSLPAYAPGNISCSNCHLSAGRVADAAPLTGSHTRFPKYLERSAAVIPLADRVNYCFTRSLAGTKLPVESREMQDILAYIAWLSRGVTVGAGDKLPGAQGLPVLESRKGDKARGEAVYSAKCATCHLPNGEGQPTAQPMKIPAVWGPKSFSVGASMSRQSKAASFIWNNMPWGMSKTLTQQEAWDVAAYITSKPRPDSPGKETDWPGGGVPSDVPYATKGHEAYLPPPVLTRAKPAGAIVPPPRSVRQK